MGLGFGAGRVGLAESIKHLGRSVRCGIIGLNRVAVFDLTNERSALARTVYLIAKNQNLPSISQHNEKRRQFRTDANRTFCLSQKSTAVKGRKFRYMSAYSHCAVSRSTVSAGCHSAASHRTESHRTAPHRTAPHCTKIPTPHCTTPGNSRNNVFAPSRANSLHEEQFINFDFT